MNSNFVINIRTHRLLPTDWEGVPQHHKVVKGWRDIKQIAVGFSNIMGLTEAGTVLYHSVDGYTDPHFYDSE